MPSSITGLNSATKYPSINTHHQLDPKNGGLLEEVTAFSGPVVLTEKVDGTNGRIVVLEDGDYFIGAREDLLYAKGDRIENPAHGIVAALKPVAQAITGSGRLQIPAGGAAVLFLEVYGGKVGQAAKQYQSSGAVGHRLFDVAHVPGDVLGWDPARISAWRENGGQRWLDEDGLQAASSVLDIALTPRLGTIDGRDLPVGVEDTLAWLAELLPTTRVALDEGAQGGAEGIVLRSTTRDTISKARFQDYQRTLSRRPRTKN